jgi:hypothetical protein
MDLRQIVAETHLTADTLVVVYPNPIGLQSAGGGFLVEQINAVLYRAVQLAQGRAGAAAAIFVHHGKKSCAFTFLFLFRLCRSLRHASS